MAGLAPSYAPPTRQLLKEEGVFKQTFPPQVPECLGMFWATGGRRECCCVARPDANRQAAVHLRRPTETAASAWPSVYGERLLQLRAAMGQRRLRAGGGPSRKFPGM